MIYLDNAATSRIKPQEVYDAFEYYIKEVAVSPGRGSYALGIEASRMLYKSRVTVAKFFGMENDNVIFTKNSTEAINMFFNGFLSSGDHVLISCYEHNSVLRPLETLRKQKNIEYTIIARDDLLLAPSEIYKKYVKPNTKVFAVTLSSNLTGRVVFNPFVTKFMNDKGITTFVDASQGASKIKISPIADGINYIAFTGHKDLLALPGVGGLVCRERPEWQPLIQGGTGVLGDSYVNPQVFPEAYEAGTLNMPAIWSLHKSIIWISQNYNQLLQNSKELTNYLISELKTINGAIIYDEDFERVGVVGINVKGKKTSDIVRYLDAQGICVRGGIHCAILAHEALGTKETGIIRISIGWDTTKKDIDGVIEALRNVGE